jgi:predicted negative regulator of RcsB-dependent stress response
MQPRNKSEGFHVVELVIIIALVGLLGFIGWRVWQTRQQSTTATTTSSQSTNVPVVNSTSDLDKVGSMTSEINVDNDLRDLDALEQDLSSL